MTDVRSASMAKRLLAVAAAAALIVGAIFLRKAITGDDTPTAAPGATTTLPNARQTVVWCLEDLRVACEAAFGNDPTVSLTVETMAATLARLTAANVADDLPDAWITFAPLPEVAKDTVTRADGPADQVATSSDRLATTPFVIATRPERAPLLTAAAACQPAPNWHCLGDLAGTKWSAIGGPESFQNIKPAFGDPTTSATALMVWASAVGQYLGTEAYSINDVQADDDFIAWGRSLRAADPLKGAGDPLAELVLSRVQRDVAGGTQAELSQLTGLATVGTYGQVDLVVSGFAGTTLRDSQRAALLAAVATSGWTAADAATPAATRPSFTTFVALQNTWKDLG
jgi:hypothetical protein